MPSSEFSFRTAGNIIAGEHCTRNIVTHLQRIGSPRRVLVVTQPPIRAIDGVARILDELERAQVVCTVVDEIGVEPSIQNLSEIHARTAGVDCDAVIGIGGGSVLDASKLLSVLRTNGKSLNELRGTDNIPLPGIPLCLIPTTAGTGSEVTPNAIISLPDEKLKEGVVSGYLLPSLSLVDPTLTYGLPRSVTAATGLDAFIHSFESFFSKRANPISDMFALRSIELISQSIVEAYEHPSDAEARGKMMYGALYGGMAITAAGTTAVHALAYPLGGKFKIAHGLANAMLLPPVFRYNADAVGERIFPVAAAMGVAEYRDWRASAEAVLERIREWSKRLEVPQDLAEFGVKRSDIPDLAAAAAKVTRLLVNNPKEMSVEDIAAVYGTLFGGESA